MEGIASHKVKRRRSPRLLTNRDKRRLRTSVSENGLMDLCRITAAFNKGHSRRKCEKTMQRNLVLIVLTVKTDAKVFNYSRSFDQRLTLALNNCI